VGEVLCVSTLLVSVHWREFLTSTILPFNYRSNLARPRFIPKQAKNGVKVHRSVKLRMEAQYEDEKLRAKGQTYVPRAELRVMPTWID
jgi:hypothetical protein